MTIGHGSILAGTVATPDIDAALSDYRDRLGLDLVADGPIDADLAASWGCTAVAGERMAVLRPTSGSRCVVRLVEQPVPATFTPMRTFGWAAFELTVRNVFGWPARLAGSGFDIVGPPREIEGLPYFVAMQVTGRGREMLYLNEVRSDTPSSDLPRAQCPVDRVFICILATADLPSTVEWYRDRLKLEAGGRYDINYTMLNHAFGLPDGTISTLQMVQRGRLPIVEVDAYPAAAAARAVEPGRLPPGNALVTLAVDLLDELQLDWIMPPAHRPGSPYDGARSATVRGSAGELIELVELP